MRSTVQQWEETQNSEMRYYRSNEIHGSGIKSATLGEDAQRWDDKYSYPQM